MTSCNFCGINAGYLPFKCSYCGRYFCKEHRIPENHGCTMDRPSKAQTTQTPHKIKQKSSVSVNSGYKYSSKTRHEPESNYYKNSSRTRYEPESNYYKNSSRTRYESKSKKIFSFQNFCLSFFIGLVVFICVGVGVFVAFQYNPNLPSGIQVKDGNEIVWDIEYNEQNCNNLLNHYAYFNIDTSYTQKKMNIVRTNGTTMFGLTMVGILVDGFIKKDDSNTWEQSVDNHAIQFQCIEDTEYYSFNIGLYLFSTFDIPDYYIIPNDLDYYDLAVDVCNRLGSGGYFTRGLPVERENGFYIIGLALTGQGIVDIYIEYSGSILSSYRLNYNSESCITMKAIDLIPGIPNFFLLIVILISILGLITPFVFNLGKYVDRLN